MKSRNEMLRGVKVGDELWDFLFGWGIVTNINEKSGFPVVVKFYTLGGEREYEFTFEGKEYSSDPHPRLFWDEIKYEIPKKPFNLEEELIKLEKINFVSEEPNSVLTWDYQLNKITLMDYNFCEIPNVNYFTEESVHKFLKVIKGKNISKEEFFSAYKKVFG